MIDNSGVRGAVRAAPRDPLVGCCSVTSASNSLDPADAGLPVQVCVINLIDGLDTFHEVRNSSNCVHWLYARW